MDTIGWKSWIGVSLGVAVFIGGIACLAGYSTKCQRCDKWFSMSTIKK